MTFATVLWIRQLRFKFIGMKFDRLRNMTYDIAKHSSEKNFFKS